MERQIELYQHSIATSEMRFAYPMQKIQDWWTQQWVIFRGRKINSFEASWLMGPFGNQDVIGEDFINQFAKKEKYRS